MCIWVLEISDFFGCLMVLCKILGEIVLKNWFMISINIIFVSIIVINMNGIWFLYWVEKIVFIRIVIFL